MRPLRRTREDRARSSHSYWRPPSVAYWVSAWGLVLTLVDRRLRSAEQIVAVTSVECFGYVPRMNLQEGTQSQDDGRFRWVMQSVLRRARSAVLERSGRAPRFVGVTSCYCAEGKSTLAANWARFIARDGSRVLLSMHHAVPTSFRATQDRVRRKVCTSCCGAMRASRPTSSRKLVPISTTSRPEQLNLAGHDIEQSGSCNQRRARMPYDWVILGYPQ